MARSFIHPQTKQPLSETEARASHDAGKGYGVRYEVNSGRTNVILSTRTVWIRFLDEYGRLVWALTWGKEDAGKLEIGNFSGTGYLASTDGSAPITERWKSMLMPRTNGKWRLHQGNMQTWRSIESEVAIDAPRLSYPAFGSFDDYLDFDYSSLEAAALDFPPRLFPDGAPEPARSIRSWVDDIRGDRT